MQISTVFSTVISTVNSTVDYCPTPELLTAMSNFATYCRWVPPFNSERADIDAVWLGWWGWHANFQCNFHCNFHGKFHCDYCPTPELLNAMPSMPLIADWCLYFIVKEQSLRPCGWGGEGGMKISTVISTVNSTRHNCSTPELLTAMPSFATYCRWLLSIYKESAEFEAVWLGWWGWHANFYCIFHCNFHCNFHCTLLPNP
jgi:hypothetical protein